MLVEANAITITVRVYSFDQEEEVARRVELMLAATVAHARPN